MHALRGSRSTRFKRGDQHASRKSIMRSEGRDARASREAIHAFQVIHAFQGDLRASTEAIHSLEGISSTRSKGGHPRASWEVIHALEGRPL
jgi:hypothetical protein